MGEQEAAGVLGVAEAVVEQISVEAVGAAIRVEGQPNPALPASVLF